MKNADLIEFLIDAVASDRKCQNALIHTRRFCEDHGIDFVAVQAKLNGRGIECDCEVLLSNDLDMDAELPRGA